MKIADVSLFKISARVTEPIFFEEARQVKPLDLYPEFSHLTQVAEPAEDPQRLQALYVQIQTDVGVSGLFGPIEEPQAFVIQKSLRPFLLGRDPLANETLLDQMLRLDRHGRSGMFMTAVSVVDCALWDLKGKVWKQPESGSSGMDRVMVRSGKRKIWPWRGPSARR